jgi:tRNA threonylcarbamoyladenosine biosynthesis protein TsaB
MSLILSIETSTTVCSVALTKDNVVLSKEILFAEQSHSTHLTLLIDKVLKNVDHTMSELDAVAVSEGPGSYTGLRIGVSTAKGLCYALSIPLISVSTLAAMAHQMIRQEQKKVLYVPMLDARRMEVYTATYNRSMAILDEVRPLVLDENSFSETLRDHSVFFFGNGSAKFAEVLSHENARFFADVVPEAWSVGLLAADKLKKGQVADVAYFEPNYLKEYQATKPKKLL